MTAWVGTSWKMNKTLAEGLAFAEALAAFMPGFDDRIRPFVIPPFTAIREVKRALAGTRAMVGAQNMHWEDAGAWTGEISPLMLRDCGVELVELGHSERREHFGETDRSVGLKTAAAVRHGFVPLVCVGETWADRESGRADAVLGDQVAGALQFLEPGQAFAPVVFAYEPVWAIGARGVPAGADYAGLRQAAIKRAASRVLTAEPPVLYGGSVGPGNVAEMMRAANVDGLFIGRSAWEPSGYIDILRRASAALTQNALPAEEIT